jgi:acetyl-CoA C-acetyltransferase
VKLRRPIGLTGLRRTAIGRLAGALAGMEPSALLASALRAALGQTTLPVDDVIVGNVRNSVGNIGRVGALAAGLPVETPAQTVDRQCASSLEALAIAAAKIDAGLARGVLVGGVESASRCPWMFEKTARPYAYGEPRPYTVRMAPEEIGDPPMGETAEILADEFGIGREEMDRFALGSHRRAAAAHERGRFEAEIVPVEPPRRKGKPEPFTRDESVREDTSLEALAKLPPAFRSDGRVTAGNASPLSDGASACLAASADAFERAGIAPEAWLTGVTTVALEPRRMGMGPALAVPRLLEALGWRAGDVGLFEINEAFAGQILAVNRELRLPADVLNPDGGAVALGHPLGATGLRLVVTLAHGLRDRGLPRGVAALCVGGGQGMAAALELGSSQAGATPR